VEIMRVKTITAGVDTPVRMSGEGSQMNEWNLMEKLIADGE
jgi:hypothetical protein